MSDDGMELIGAISPPECPGCDGKLVGQYIDRPGGTFSGDPPEYWTCPNCGYVEDRYGICTGRDAMEREIESRHKAMARGEIKEMRAIP